MVTVVSFGTWPVYKTKAVIKWLDGNDGAVIHRDSVGVFASSSPVVAELTGDDRDEVISVFNLSMHRERDKATSQLVIFDGGDEKERLVEMTFQGFSAATPHLSDIDGNGKLDLIHIHWGIVQRTELDAVEEPTLIWNQFRGPNRDGVLK